MRVIITHVESQWPKTLAEWDNRDIPYPSTASMNGGDSSNHLEPASTIIFATEFGVPTILPAAFYMMAVTKGKPAEGDKIRPGRWDLLDAATQVKVLEGRDAMRSYFIRALSPLQYATCTNKCSSRGSIIASNMLMEPEFYDGHSDCLEMFRTPSTKSSLGFVSCSICVASYRKLGAEARVQFWSDLSIIFKL